MRPQCCWPIPRAHGGFGFGNGGGWLVAGLQRLPFPLFAFEGLGAAGEAREESGLAEVRVASPGIFDCDVHGIPARREEAAHDHYDVRFLLEADSRLPLVVSEESHDLAWVAFDDVPRLAPDPSVLRMLYKTPR